ncbi:MAG TPA: nucleoside-diphosphate sugar epimerase/dehydratase [Acidimicrobiia bacterium]|nr:nucleoside-diphosphate sugar epimerase/dehydratase [Acidimicrobiia bacterium]
MSVAQNAARVRADVTFALIDAFIISMAYVAGLVARFMDGLGVSTDWWPSFWRVLPMIVLVHLIANVAFGTYGHVWEYASVAEALRVGFASAAAGIVIVASMIIGRDAFQVEQPIPMSVVILGAMFTLVGMGAIRFRSRMFSFKRMAIYGAPVRALIVGTGRPAAVLARQAPNLEPTAEVIGFVDIDHAGPHARRLVGKPVWAGVDRVPDLVRTYRADQVIVAADVPESTLRDLVDACMSVDVALRIVPNLNELLKGHAAESIRNIELSDLLPRAAVKTDLTPVAAMLEGRRILVTGAGGSIGSEIVKQCLEFNGTTVYALDNDETHLHDAMSHWNATGNQPIRVLCDIRDGGRLAQVFDRFRPQVVFHAAAHKHVPILEDCPEEAVKTNVEGTSNVLSVVKEFGIERFVLISTDKAVRPSSVMGATKRIAEMMLQSASAESDHGVYTAVRFGNVLGSRGSVVPTFMNQIQAGGPVTVTDPRMTRYFMTVPEAVQLVLQSGALASGGEVFVLDMGEPVRIMDLASRLIRLSGMVPGRDIQIEITGMRPGEKLEEVLSDGPLVPSDHPKINKASIGYPDERELADAVHELRNLANSGEREAVRMAVHDLAHVVGVRDAGEAGTLRDAATWN